MLTQSGEESIERLRRLNAVGDYREALRLQLIYDTENSTEPAPTQAEREIQLAVAMQHAGFYLLSYDAYGSARILATESGQLDGTLDTRIKIQLATLDERLGRFRRAQSILASISPPTSDGSFHIARMADTDWYFLTYAKVLIALGKYKSATAHLKEAEGASRHYSDWRQAIRLVLRAKVETHLKRSDFETVAAISRSYREYDAPGEPWIPLFFSQHLGHLDPARTIPLLEDAVQRSQALGKYFLVAALYEQLALLYCASSGMESDARLAFRRSLNAFGRCQLLTHREIRSRMSNLGILAGFRPAEVADLAVRSSSVLLDRSELHLGPLLSERAVALGTSPAREFEKFLEEWAPFRFAGRVESLPVGETAADVLLIRHIDGRAFGTAIQAKHYAQPRRSVPTRNPRLRELGQKYHATIDRYVFVVSTSAVGGWRDSMWHAQHSEAVRNVVADQSVAVTVVTEPELQTDIVLNDKLLRWLLSPKFLPAKHPKRRAT